MALMPRCWNCAFAYFCPLCHDPLKGWMVCSLTGILRAQRTAWDQFRRYTSEWTCRRQEVRWGQVWEKPAMSALWQRKYKGGISIRKTRGFFFRILSRENALKNCLHQRTGGTWEPVPASWTPSLLSFHASLSPLPVLLSPAVKFPLASQSRVTEFSFN